MRDALAQRLVGLNSPNVDWQATRLVICYINGELSRRVMSLRERTNEDYIEANYDGLEDIDMIENWWEVRQEAATRSGSLPNYTTRKMSRFHSSRR